MLSANSMCIADKKLFNLRKNDTVKIRRMMGSSTEFFLDSRRVAFDRILFSPTMKERKLIAETQDTI
jgi:hypothetical protein